MRIYRHMRGQLNVVFAACLGIAGDNDCFIKLKNWSVLRIIGNRQALVSNLIAIEGVINAAALHSICRTVPFPNMIPVLKVTGDDCQGQRQICGQSADTRRHDLTNAEYVIDPANRCIFGNVRQQVRGVGR